MKATELRKLQKLHTQYCLHFHNCDKDYNCKGGIFCSAFRHTEEFSSLKENKE